MPAIPLGMKAYKRGDGFVPEVQLKNLYLEKDETGISPDNTLRITRPGLADLYSLASPVRGMSYRTSVGQTLTVAGGSLYVNGVSAGAIGGTANTPMVGTSFLHAIVGDKLYLYDTVVVPITTPNDPFDDTPQTVQDVEQLNQYLIVLMTNGRFYWLLPGEMTIDPLNFATAESAPDGGVAIKRVGDEFWIFGTETIEPWQSTGDQDAPFQRSSGRLYERGALDRDTVNRFDNSVMWVAEDGQVCRGGAVPQVVSDNGLSERIRKRTGAMSAWVFGLDGHEFYVLRIPGQGTFGYDAQTQSWCQFQTRGRADWAPHVGYDAGGQVLCGDSASGKVWTLDADGDDAGTPIDWAVTGTIALVGKTPRHDSLSVGVGTPADCVVGVRWRDGQDDYPAYVDQLDVRAPFDIASLYRLGQPLQPYREVEFSGSTRVRIAGAMANEAYR